MAPMSLLNSPNFSVFTSIVYVSSTPTNSRSENPCRLMSRNVHLYLILKWKKEGRNPPADNVATNWEESTGFQRVKSVTREQLRTTSTVLVWAGLAFSFTSTGRTRFRRSYVEVDERGFFLARRLTSVLCASLWVDAFTRVCDLQWGFPSVILRGKKRGKKKTITKFQNFYLKT